MQTLLEKQVPDAATRQKWLKIASDKDMSIMDLRQHIISKDVAKVVFGLSRLSHDRQQLEEAAAGVYKNLSEPSAQPRKADLCSAQKMEAGCVSLDELAYSENQTELERIPQVELEKFLVDCMLFNMDRHLGNALARKITLSEIASRIPGASEAERERLLALEQHAKNIGSTYVYELILIDHGTTIPDQKFSDLTAKMEWRALDQTEKPLSATTKRRILELDLAAIVQKVREDQGIFEAKFGSFCSVSDEAYSFMRFCCILLQEGVRQDKTMFEVAEIYENLEASGLLAIYDKAAQAKEAEAWISIQKLISEILATQRKE